MTTIKIEANILSRKQKKLYIKKTVVDSTITIFDYVLYETSNNCDIIPISA